MCEYLLGEEQLERSGQCVLGRHGGSRCPVRKTREGVQVGYKVCEGRRDAGLAGE